MLHAAEEITEDVQQRSYRSEGAAEEMKEER